MAQTALTGVPAPPPATASTSAAAASAAQPARVLWRLAGAFALAHVLLIPVGLALQGGPRFEEGVDGIRRGYVEGDLPRIVAGGIVEGFGFVLLIPALVFLARVVGRGTEGARWASQTAMLAGLAYVTVTMAVGFPAGAAALWGAQHGLDLDTAFALNNLRNFAYFLSLALLGAHALGLGIAALAGHERGLGRWVSWGGLASGAALVLSVPAATIGQQDWGTLVWMVWWIGVGVLLLRHRP